MQSLRSISQVSDKHPASRHDARKKKGDQAGRPVVAYLPDLPDDLEVGAAAVIDPNAAAIEAPAIALTAG